MVTGIDVDRVRLLCGDPAGESQVLDDGAIYFFLGEHGSDKYAAAAAAADAIAARYAGRVDVRVGILSSSDSQLAAQFRATATELRRQALVVALVIWSVSFAGLSAYWAAGGTEEENERDDTGASTMALMT